MILPLSLTRVSSLLLLLSPAAGFYIPGVEPQPFKRGDDVPLRVNSMTSIHTQVPKDVYRLPSCIPVDGPKMASENLGEFLTGNKIQSSRYSIKMLTDAFCTKLCQIKLSKLDAANLKLHIKYGYHNNWIIDNLPSAAVGLTQHGERQKHYAGGFPIGFIASDTQEAYVYNHVNIIVEYHQRDPTVERYRVVGFAVEPMSIHHEYQGGYEWDGEEPLGWTKQLSTCSTSAHNMERGMIRANQIVSPNELIMYTYDVTWVQSDTAWASRWDVYLTEDHLVPAEVHWYSITNSIVVALFLALLIICILVRNLKRDIAEYNAVAALAVEEKDGDVAKTGWLSVHADVFRQPDNYPIIFAVFIGTGVQIIFSTFCVISLSAVGFLSPARRGSLMIAILVFFALCGILSGYTSSRLYKSFGGRQFHLCTILTATLFPGLAFFIFLFFNIYLFFLRSSASAPFLVVGIVATMWCFVTIPLVFLGANFGYEAETVEYPTVTSTIARAIPPPPALLHPYVGLFVAGILPFSAVYVEFFFIMTSLWMGQYYDVFGFTLIVFMILCITCAELTVLLVYYQLRAENHRWWWYSFFTAGSVAFYMFIYSISWFRRLEASTMVITYLLYFGYMFLVSFAVLLATGTVGALTSLWFIRKIFGTIKVD
jgi:transmembrane 9 superfamily protein 2/4